MVKARRRVNQSEQGGLLIKLSTRNYRWKLIFLFISLLCGLSLYCLDSEGDRKRERIMFNIAMHKLILQETRQGARQGKIAFPIQLIGYEETEFQSRLNALPHRELFYVTYKFDQRLIYIVFKTEHPRIIHDGQILLSEYDVPASRKNVTGN